MGGWDLFFIVVPIVIGALVTGAYAVIALSPADFRSARMYAWAASVFGMVLVVGWMIKTESSVWIRIPIAIFLVAVIVVLLGEGLRWVAKREGVISSTAPAPSEQTRADLHHIDTFIGRKNENELREEFDIPKILDLNIWFIIQHLDPSRVSKKRLEYIVKYFNGGARIVDSKYVRIIKQNNSFYIEHPPGEIGEILVSKKYENSLNELQHLTESPYLNGSIISALKVLSETIVNNMNVMIDSLNESFSKSPMNIIGNFDSGTIYYGATTNIYWSKFENLRPKVDAVNQAVRNYLGVN